MQQVVRFLRDDSGARVAYADAGGGPCIVCPAWWVSHVERDVEHPGFARFFGELAEHSRVVRYDRPGVGLSDRDVGPRTLSAEVALLAALIDHLELPRVALLALSCGGPVALRYAAAHPDRVDRLCFFGSFVDGGDVAAPATRSALVDLVRAHWGLGSAALADLFNPAATPDDAAWLRRSQREWAGGARAAELLQLTYEMQARDAAETIAAPTLVLHRRGDRAIPLEAGRRLAAAVPGARLQVLDGDAHPPWFGDTAVAQPVLAHLVPAPARSSAGTSANRCELDAGRRALRIDGEQVNLTRLELLVIQELIRAGGNVVTRDELLASAWRQPFAGSNKVDVVIRSLRRKLGTRAPAIETVTGHGYRFAGWD